VPAVGPLPVADRDSAPWWERLARHEFAVQRCGSCATPRFPPRAFCPRCRTESVRWEVVEPAGTVVSWVVSHQAFGPGAAGPYVVVMVELAAVPGGFAYGGWRAGREPAGGEAVRGVYDDVSPGMTLLNWRPARA